MPPAFDRPPPLWPFSVHVYALPGVAPLCRRLQDEHGLDVNVLLAILWQAHRGASLDDAVLERLSLAAQPTHARVLEIRALRRTVASDRTFEPRWQETHEHLKAAELAAERMELTALEAVLICEPSFIHRPSSSSPELTMSDGVTLDPAELARDALSRHAERSGAAPCRPLLAALVDAILPRPR